MHDSCQYLHQQTLLVNISLIYTTTFNVLIFRIFKPINPTIALLILYLYIIFYYIYSGVRPLGVVPI